MALTSGFRLRTGSGTPRQRCHQILEEKQGAVHTVEETALLGFRERQAHVILVLQGAGGDEARDRHVGLPLAGALEAVLFNFSVTTQGSPTTATCYQAGVQRQFERLSWPPGTPGAHRGPGGAPRPALPQQFLGSIFSCMRQHTSRAANVNLRCTRAPTSNHTGRSPPIVTRCITRRYLSTSPKKSGTARCKLTRLSHTATAPGDHLKRQENSGRNAWLQR